MATGKCPNCPNTFPIEPRLYGKKAKCNVCGHVFNLTAPPPIRGRDSHSPKSLMRSIGEFVGHLSRALRTGIAPPSLPPQGAFQAKNAQATHMPLRIRGPSILIAATVVVGAYLWGWSSDARKPQAPAAHGETLDSQRQNATRAAGQRGYTERDALKDISAERRRYAGQQEQALASDRSRSEAARRASSKKELEELNCELFNLQINEPRRPYSGMSAESAFRFVQEYRRWGERRRLVRRKVFAIQDEIGDFALKAGLVSEIALLESRDPDIANRNEALILSMMAVNADELRNYRSIWGVQREQWVAEAELLQERRESLRKSSGTSGHRTATPKRESADVAVGSWHFERCADGDTIEISVGNGGQKEKVRLLNINTPEEGEPGYLQATAALEGMLRYQNIELEFEKPGEPTRDRYGRVLAFVFVGDTLVNYAMVKYGWTNLYSDYGRGRYASPLQFAESDARTNRRGLHR